MLLELMSRLSLTYGAIDLILTPDGRYLFLEVNPNGQWLWLDDMLSLGISRAVAKWLSEDMQ
jgi:D-alanine-D-alanine ligase-like ATP-grasp enzyme